MIFLDLKPSKNSFATFIALSIVVFFILAYADLKIFPCNFSDSLSTNFKLGNFNGLCGIGAIFWSKQLTLIGWPVGIIVIVLIPYILAQILIKEPTKN